MNPKSAPRRKAIEIACAFAIEQLEGRTYFSIPAAPASLAAAASSISQINLSWADQSTDETGFKIERSTNGGSSYSQIATVNSNVTTYSNTALASQTTYTYRVRAYNADGNSAYTAAMSDTTAGPPAAPSNLSATPVSVSQISLNWTNNDSSISAATSYKVEKSSDGGSTFAQVTGSLSPGTSSYTVTGLATGTSYVFRVRASNGTNSFSAYSNTATATTVTAPADPSNLIATTLSTSQIKLDWTRNDSGASAATSFKVELSSDGGSTFSQVASLGGTAVTYTATGLTAGVTYVFRVRAYNGAYSNYSNTASALTINAPAAPGNLAATVVSPVQVNLSWTRNDSGATVATSYKIEASTDGGSTYTQIASAPSSWSTYSATGLNPATAYLFRIRAYNGAYSAYSSTASATTPAIPTAPSSLTATAASTTQINLSWTPTDGGVATSYLLERSYNGGSTYSTLATLSPGTSSYSYTGANGLTAYTFRVRAYNGVYSPSSNAVALTSANAFPSPSGLTAVTVSSTQVDLHWTDNSSDETSFVIQKKTGNGTWTNLVTLPADTTSYSDTGLANSTTTIAYRAVTEKNGVVSLASNQSETTTADVDLGLGMYRITLGGVTHGSAALSIQEGDDHLAVIGDGVVTANSMKEAIQKAIAGYALVHAQSGLPYNDGQDRTFTWGDEFTGGAFKAQVSVDVISPGLYTGQVTLEDIYGWTHNDNDNNDDSWSLTVQKVTLDRLVATDLENPGLRAVTAKTAAPVTFYVEWNSATNSNSIHLTALCSGLGNISPSICLYQIEGSRSSPNPGNFGGTGTDVVLSPNANNRRFEIDAGIDINHDGRLNFGLDGEINEVNRTIVIYLVNLVQQPIDTRVPSNCVAPYSINGLPSGTSARAKFYQFDPSPAPSPDQPLIDKSVGSSFNLNYDQTGLAIGKSTFVVDVVIGSGEGQIDIGKTFNVTRDEKSNKTAEIATVRSVGDNVGDASPLVPINHNVEATYDLFTYSVDLVQGSKVKYLKLVRTELIDSPAQPAIPSNAIYFWTEKLTLTVDGVANEPVHMTPETGGAIIHTDYSQAAFSNPNVWFSDSVAIESRIDDIFFQNSSGTYYRPNTLLGGLDGILNDTAQLSVH